VVASHNSVIIKTSPTRLENIQNAVAKLDTPIQNLLISVITTHQDLANAGVIDLASSHDGMPGIHSSTEGIEDRENLRQIKLLDGHAARVEISRTRLLEQVSVLETMEGYRGFSTRYTQQQNGQGFYLIPNLQGDNEVLIQIQRWSEREKDQNRIDSQSATTSTRVRLGEWVDLFGGKGNQSQEFAGINHDLRPNDAHLFIKVEKINP
jgi:hypothetical protein